MDGHGFAGTIFSRNTPATGKNMSFLYSACICRSTAIAMATVELGLVTWRHMPEIVNVAVYGCAGAMAGLAKTPAAV